MRENDEKIIYQDYINCYDCWVRASFIPAAWDAEGNLTHVMLTDEGARVETAANGKEAVDAFAHSSPQYYDVILMDMMMPVPSRFLPSPPMPFLMTSANAGPPE